MTLLSRTTTAILCAVMLVAACKLGDEEPLRDEAALRKSFESHRTEFEELRRLFAQDTHLVRVAPTFTRLENDWSWPREDIGLTEARWDRYRSLFETTGVVDGVELQEPLTFFYMSSVGLAVSGAGRGVAYTEQRPSPLVDSLPAFAGDRVVYVPLGDDWYLFHWEF